MGIFAKIKKAWFDTIVWETIDDEFYDELEDSLIMADLGATVAHDAVKKLRDVVYQKSIQRGDDVKQALREILIEKLNVGDTALDMQAARAAGCTAVMLGDAAHDGGVANAAPDRAFRDGEALAGWLRGR